jgi:alpha-galactosidase
MCLSGDVTELSSEQRNVIKDGIAFYKKAVPFIKNGKSTILSNRSKSDRHPDGYQAVLRKNENGALLVIHTFDNAPDSITVPLGDDYKITDIYSDMQPNLSIYDKCLTLKSNRNFSGLGIILSLEK